MATNIDISAFGGAATFAATDNTKISIGGQTLAALGITITAGDSSVTVPGYGVIAITAAGKLSFTAAAGASGSFSLTNNGVVATFTAADFSAATNASLVTTGVAPDAGYAVAPAAFGH